MKTLQDFLHLMDFIGNQMVQMRVSVQLQRALNDTRWWIRVLSSKTIGHFKNK